MLASLHDIAAMRNDDLMAYFKTNTDSGLGSGDARSRLAESGPNTIATKSRDSGGRALLKQFRSPLVLLLLGATAISFAVGETVSASIIFLIVLASVSIDFFQERDARNAAERLKQLVKSRVSVIRDGREGEILPVELCLGDIVLLNAGKIIPADVRIISAKDFFVNQSSLTGESFPCEKNPDAAEFPVGNISVFTNMAFMGSSVITGTSRAVVVRTGSGTEFGKIAKKLVEREGETEFSRGMRDFGFLIMRVTIALVLLIFFINALLKENILESFMFAIAIAVGLTPELLPMIMSLTMSKGSLQMAKKGVIVKRLSAIPNFGSMDVLCTDKTGTITEDRIQLIRCVDAWGNDTDAVFRYAYQNSYFQTGIKNPLDEAILGYGTPDISTVEKVDEIPFDFYRKRMSVVVKEEGKTTLICKGAPEEILKECTQGNDLLAQAFKEYEILSEDGFRVLAIAVKEVGDKKIFSRVDEILLTFVGFVAFLDPPKADAAAVINALAAIGVEVKIITGDNHLVTRKICRELNLPIKGIIQGHEMETLTDDALKKRVLDTTIFTRFSPDQKNRVIHALQAFHHAVGYMGDGINDAPSLKAADIGISVSSATEVAKESASIILTQKDLLVLKEGILEGRKTFGNTMKYVLMGLSSNFGNMFSVAVATLFLPFLPMLPVQILLNNFLYDTSQVAIPSDNVDQSYLESPRRWNIKMIYRYMFFFGITSSVFDLITFWMLYKIFSVNEAMFRTGWFMESLATQILVVFIIRTQQSPFFLSRPSKGLVAGALLCLGAGWLLPYLPFASKIGFQVLPFHIVGFIVMLTLVYLITAEFVKRHIYKFIQA